MCRWGHLQRGAGALGGAVLRGSTVDSVPIDPDDDEPDTREADGLRRIMDTETPSGAAVTLWTAAGDPAEETAHVAHRQSRPVLVIPTHPGSFKGPAPWEG